MHKVNFIILIGVLFFAPSQKLISQNFIGFSTGINTAKLIESKEIRTDFESIYPFRTGYFFSLNYERNNATQKLGLGFNLMYAQQNLEYDFTGYSKFGATHIHYEYKYNDLQFDISGTYNLLPTKKYSLKCFLGLSVLQRFTEETINAHGSYPYPTNQIDSSGQQVVVHIPKYWEKNSINSDDLSNLNYGLNFGFYGQFPIKNNLSLILENRNSIFINNQFLFEDINVPRLLNCSFSVGLRVKI